MNKILKLKFGSHLYGTSTPDSDIDIKGVFVPEINDLLLGKISKSITNNTNKSNTKNSSNDINEEYYSLHYFIDLACKGETVALDMLHAPLDYVDYYNDTWKFIYDNKQKFYTKNLKAFEGSRLNAAKLVIDKLKFCLDNYVHSPNNKLSDIWSLLPQGEYLKFIEDSPNGIRQYEICGIILQETVTLEYAYKQLKHLLDKLVVEVDELATKRNLPDKVDRKFWDNFILEIMHTKYANSLLPDIGI